MCEVATEVETSHPHLNYRIAKLSFV